MQLSRMFSNQKYKGTRDYLRVQGRYELARTALCFAISLSLFFAGIIATGGRKNLLTLVAVLGCLPACKSAVDAFMYLRYKGCSSRNADVIEAHMDGLKGLYDRVFTSYEKNYQVAHMAVKGNTVCGFTQDDKFMEQDFYKHIDGILRKDGFRDVSVKIFTDIEKYSARLEQLRELETNERSTDGILETLKSVSL